MTLSAPLFRTAPLRRIGLLQCGTADWSSPIFGVWVKGTRKGATSVDVAPFGWDTRARTRNNRTRICCVANYTISQFSFSNPRMRTPLSELRCKGSAFSETGKGF